VRAVCASVLAEESYALFFWLSSAGIAIAARMPMIRITTRSSISVKPPSSRTPRVESFLIKPLLSARSGSRRGMPLITACGPTMYMGITTHMARVYENLQLDAQAENLRPVLILTVSRRYRYPYRGYPADGPIKRDPRRCPGRA